ncbi:hypothetical protein BSG1_11546 [Bacillus sp. SG-1]|nr:hypothetical protein BSG1_11546 [Bacillus sp. SG-1]
MGKEGFCHPEWIDRDVKEKLIKLHLL